MICLDKVLCSSMLDIKGELLSRCKYKSAEVQLLTSFLQPDINLSMPSIIVEGPPSSGKSYTLNTYLELLKKGKELNHIIIECEYCFTQREILRRLQKELLKHYKLLKIKNTDKMQLSDSISTFPGCMQEMIKYHKLANNGRIDPVVIVLDRIDRLPIFENPGELIKCLGRLYELGEDFQYFSVVSVVTRCDFLDLSTLSLPIVNFERYSLKEFKEILVVHWPEFWDNRLYCIEEDNSDSENETEKIELELDDNMKKGIFRQFIDLMMDTYSGYLGLSVEIVIPILRRIWPIFLNPILKEGTIMKDKNDILTTFIKNKKILGKSIAVVGKLDNSDLSLSKYTKADQVSLGNVTELEVRKGHYDLSFKTKYLLIAAFLASYNEAKYDRQFFSKGNQYNSSIIRQRKKRMVNIESGNGQLRRAMNAAIPFKLERLLAILNSIWTSNVEDSTTIIDDVELMTEIATLVSLKALVKFKGGDTIGGQTKWKCNVHWNVIKKFADDVGFEIENHLQE